MRRGAPRLCARWKPASRTCSAIEPTLPRTPFRASCTRWRLRAQVPELCKSPVRLSIHFIWKAVDPGRRSSKEMSIAEKSCRGEGLTPEPPALASTAATRITAKGLGRGCSTLAQPDLVRRVSPPLPPALLPAVIAPEYSLPFLKSRPRLPECLPVPLQNREALENSPGIRLQCQDSPPRSIPPRAFHSPSPRLVS